MRADDIARLASLSIELRPFLRREKVWQTYRHMGATLCDTILQAGLNYRTVVNPRVGRILAFWPRATTSSLFLERMEAFGLESVLDWRDPVKLERIETLTLFCVDQGLETEEHLRSWLLAEENALALLALPGVGRKTVDYLRNLVGLSTIPIDRHMTAFLERAGLQCHSYEERQQALLSLACCLDVDARCLDAAIWNLESSSSGAVRQAMTAR